MRKLKIGFTAAAFAPALLFCAAAAGAQDTKPCYNLASVRGDYAVVGNYGANVAIAFGKRSVDGKGTLTGTFIVNKPVPGSLTGDRTIVSGTQVGTYTVNCDGTGVITRILTVGTTSTQAFDDFVITGSIMKDGQLIATSIADAQRTPSTIVTGGIFLTRVWTRVPSAQPED
jgi:hypothetical protein